MAKSKVYTKTGDKGQTGLVSGTRVSKGSERLSLYGDVDELNSHLGMLISLLRNENCLGDEADFIEEIQSKLFDLGSNLACEKENAEKYKLPQITEVYITKLEEHIDSLDKNLVPLKNFILPGGCIASSQAHICRTVCRRVERELVHFNDSNPDQLPSLSIEFLNRLSDYLFITARAINNELEVDEILWRKS